MRVLGRRSDGALHLSIGSGLSVILRGGFASPPSQEDVVTRLGPWHRATSFDPNMRRRVELRLDRSRVVPLVALSVLPDLGVADDGLWSCPACGRENTVSLSAGCEWLRCPSHSLRGTSEGAVAGWETRRKGGGGGEKGAPSAEQKAAWRKAGPESITPGAKVTGPGPTRQKSGGGSSTYEPSDDSPAKVRAAAGAARSAASQKAVREEFIGRKTAPFTKPTITKVGETKPFSWSKK